MDKHIMTKCMYCNTVINNCRCASPDKKVEWKVCVECTNKADNIIIPEKDKLK